MKRKIVLFSLFSFLLVFPFFGCAPAEKPVKIGVSFGVGAAVRWDQEKIFMEEHAEQVGAEIEVRLNRTDEPKTQAQDCTEMIDSGIDVLILTPRDVNQAGDILAYAKEKKVPVISYSRIVLGEKIDFYIGYDSGRIGQKLGQYLSEAVFEGDYLILQGDPNDHNAALLNEGAMRYIAPMEGKIRIIQNASVPKWLPEEAKKIARQAILDNGGRIDAILAPNDKIAGACAEVLEELGVKTPVAITGMDAELDAVKRIVAGKQDVTIYMDLKTLATTTIDEACRLAKKEKLTINAEFDNQSGFMIPSNLLDGQLITKQNLDRILIESGYYTREQIYTS